jgi:hypothetical protein
MMHPHDLMLASQHGRNIYGVSLEKQAIGYLLFFISILLPLHSVFGWIPFGCNKPMNMVGMSILSLKPKDY